MDSVGVTFQSIDLARTADLCVQFRRDSYVCSFGSDEQFFAGDGREGYLQFLAEGIAEQPGGFVHVWQRGAIIGQLEMRIRSNQPPTGYVHLFYLAAAARGGGAGAALQAYALEFMRAGGVPCAHLSVSPSNPRALGYYAKHGWRDLGESPRDPRCRLLQLDIEP